MDHMRNQSFWELVLQDGSFFIRNVTIGGDVNLTILDSGIWGTRSKLEPLSPYFTNLFEITKLVDTKPLHFLPTWRNGKEGDMKVANRLDRFWLDENLVLYSTKYRSWVEKNHISYHYPLCLQLECLGELEMYPFKSNYSWISKKDYSSLLYKHQKHFDVGSVVLQSVGLHLSYQQLTDINKATLNHITYNI